MAELRSVCPGCRKEIFATNTTVFQLRAKRHAKSCEDLRAMVKAKALGERRQAPK